MRGTAMKRLQIAAFAFLVCAIAAYGAAIGLYVRGAADPSGTPLLCVGAGLNSIGLVLLSRIRRSEKGDDSKQ